VPEILPGLQVAGALLELELVTDEDEDEELEGFDDEDEELDGLEDEEDDGATLEELLDAPAIEHSFTPPAILLPKVAALQTKLPDRTL
jgi:hypothetical protein